MAFSNCLLLLVCVVAVQSYPKNKFFEFGEQYGDEKLPIGNIQQMSLALSTPLVFYNEPHYYLYVSIFLFLSKYLSPLKKKKKCEMWNVFFYLYFPLIFHLVYTFLDRHQDKSSYNFFSFLFLFLFLFFWCRPKETYFCTIYSYTYKVLFITFH